MMLLNFYNIRYVESLLVPSSYIDNTYKVHLEYQRTFF